MSFPPQLQVRRTFNRLVVSFLMASTTSDLDAMTHNAHSHSLNSVQMTLPLPTSHPLSSSLPPSSSQSNDTFNLSHLENTPPSVVGSTKTNHESTSKSLIERYSKGKALTRTDLYSTRPPSLPPLPLHLVPCSPPLFNSTRIFLSERNSVGSVDWPPIETALLPEGGNSGKDNDIGGQVSSVFPSHTRGSIIYTTKENPGNTTVVTRKITSSTAKKLKVIPLDNALSVSLKMSGVPRHDYEDASSEQVPLDLLYISPPTRAQSGDRRSTGTVLIHIWKFFD